MNQLCSIVIEGNLVKDPEIKFLPSGKAVGTLRIACNRETHPAGGEVKKTPIYISVEVWDKSAESCSEFLKRGSHVLVQGALAFREYVDSAGVKHSIYEIKADKVRYLDPPRQSTQTPANAPELSVAA